MNRRLTQGFLPIGVVLSILIGGCAGQDPRTLGSLNYEPEPELATTTVSDSSHEDVRQEYEELLSVVDDQHLKEQIERRIGDVYMLEGEQAQQQAESGTSYYLDAIKSYREILEKYPNSPDNAEILYQLARAYDMEGNQDEALVVLRELTTRHPQYENIAEANFRKADILFNRGAYAESEQAYRSVTQHSSSNLHLNAHYMLGWSQYKQLQFRPALDDFVYVLNQVMATAATLDELSKPNQSLAQDTLHAVSLSLDKLSGAGSIQDLDDLKQQRYVWRVYDDLGQYYLGKELYEASAETYRQFVAHYPAQDITPVLHKKMIDTYMEGSFPRQAFREKEQFVDAYGIYSSYATDRGGVVESIRPTMREYLDELARNYHARGQELQSDIQELEDLSANQQSLPQPGELETLDAGALVALNKAAYFYQQIVDTFPDHENLDQLLFSRADALFAARRFDEAIADYERVAYQPRTGLADNGAADAGYAAIIAYEEHLAGLSAETDASAEWRARAVDSMLRFAETFHSDQRSASVLTNAADYMFDLGQYQRALQTTRSLIDNQPELQRDMRQTAYGITAHSLFMLERFSEAGDDYLAQRQLLEPGSDDYKRANERLASAIYKHAETMIAREDNPGAIDELLRLKKLTPNSPIRITAQYDAATLLLELQRWPAAIAELRELAEHYPNHELAIEFPRKLAFAYEQNEDWALAAEEYLKMYRADPDPDLRREALYLAATMYENSQNYPAATTQLEAYAQEYPQPFSTNMEARYKLVQNHSRLNNNDQRLHWLQALVDGHENAGDQANERSRWLAAWANNEYGDYFAREFDRYNLYPPLAQSLAAKNEQLEKATSRYQQAADSGVFQFVTMSAYKIAELYQNLARELRESPRPEGLGGDEKALYAEILDEQARPFEEIAMDLHQSNIERAWEGDFNPWIKQSFAMMRDLHPERFGKTELIVSYGDEIR